MLDAVVIGAGAAGIAAARRLSELHLTHALVEAKPFAGGRALTDNVTLGVSVDLGAHWLHTPDENPLKGFADSLGVRYLKRAYSTRYARGAGWLSDAEASACAEYVEQCFERIEAAGETHTDRAVSELLDDQSPWTSSFSAEFAAKQGVTPREASTLDFARYVWEGDDLPVVGGFGNVVARLAAGMQLTTGCAVSRVDHSRAGAVRVATGRGDIEARAVILTVSTGVLRDGIAFDPPLPAWKRSAIEALPMGSCNKVALRFQRDVFDGLRDCLVLPQRGAAEALELVVRPDARDLVVCLVNGPFGRELAGAGEETMRDYALERLCEIFGNALRGAVAPERVFVDWDRDAYVRGSFSAALPGRADARRALALPVDTRIFFAGEATHPHFMGDVHGAWLSGLAAADALRGAIA
jgi:monoamine oxidase